MNNAIRLHVKDVKSEVVNGARLTEETMEMGVQTTEEKRLAFDIYCQTESTATSKTTQTQEDPISSKPVSTHSNPRLSEAAQKPFTQISHENLWTEHSTTEGSVGSSDYVQDELNSETKPLQIQSKFSEKQDQEASSEEDDNEEGRSSTSDSSEDRLAIMETEDPEDYPDPLIQNLFHEGIDHSIQEGLREIETRKRTNNGEDEESPIKKRLIPDFHICPLGEYNQEVSNDEPHPETLAVSSQLPSFPSISNRSSSIESKANSADLPIGSMIPSPFFAGVPPPRLNFPFPPPPLLPVQTKGIGDFEAHPDKDLVIYVYDSVENSRSFHLRSKFLIENSSYFKAELQGSPKNMRLFLDEDPRVFQVAMAAFHRKKITAVHCSELDGDFLVDLIDLIKRYDLANAMAEIEKKLFSDRCQIGASESDCVNCINRVSLAFKNENKIFQGLKFPKRTAVLWIKNKNIGDRLGNKNEVWKYLKNKYSSY